MQNLPSPSSWTSKSATSKAMFPAKLRQFSPTCYGICTFQLLDAALMQFEKACNTKRLNCCTRHVWTVNPAKQTKYGCLSSAAPATLAAKNGTHLKAKQNHRACHKKSTFDTLWNMLQCHKVPHLPHETTLRDDRNLQNKPLLALPISTTIATSRKWRCEFSCWQLRHRLRTHAQRL